MKPRVFSIYHGRFPGEKAASLFAAKEAEAFADLNIPTIMLVPRRLGRAKENIYKYYHVKNNFNVVYVPTIDLFFLPFFKGFIFTLSLIVFSISTFFYLLFVLKKDDIVYSNETLPLIFSSFISSHTVFALHDFPEKKLWFYHILFSSVQKILVTNSWKEKKLHELFPFTKNKIFCEQNAIDITEFDIKDSKEEARKKLNFPLNHPLVLYTGHLYSWKGADVLAEAGGHLPNYSIVFLGGTKEDVQQFRDTYKKYENIKILGQKPYHELPLWQKAADVLVIPNTAKEDISKYYTSPMKLYAYMASKRPIVASDLPSIREIVTDEDVIFVEPDNPQALAQGIEKALKDTGEKVENAFKKVGTHTWKARAERLLNLMQS